MYAAKKNPDNNLLISNQKLTKYTRTLRYLKIKIILWSYNVVFWITTIPSSLLISFLPFLFLSCFSLFSFSLLLIAFFHLEMKIKIITKKPHTF